MAFMEPQIELGDWIEVDGPAGTEFIPADLVGEIEEYHGALAALPESISMYCENRQAWHIRRLESRWGARLSAPGFMDATSWAVFETEEEARAHLAEAHDEDE
jgi:hypothetical protein